jgi:hypothetical protein
VLVLFSALGVVDGCSTGFETVGAVLVLFSAFFEALGVAVGCSTAFSSLFLFFFSSFGSYVCLFSLFINSYSFVIYFISCPLSKTFFPYRS